MMHIRYGLGGKSYDVMTLYENLLMIDKDENRKPALNILIYIFGRDFIDCTDVHSAFVPAPGYNKNLTNPAMTHIFFSGV